MKKNLTKKLMLSVLTLAFAVVSLGASTFAWFTISKDAEVQKLEFEVTANSGIEIGVASIGNKPSQYYVASLPESVVWTAMGKEKATFKFDARTTNNGKDAVTLANFLGTPAFYKHTTNKAIADATENAAVAALDGYAAFELYVKADMAGYIRLDVPFVENNGSVTPWCADIAYKNGAGTDVAVDGLVSYDVINSVRYAVIPTTNLDTDGVVYQQPAGTVNSLGYSATTSGSLFVYNEKYAGTDSDIPESPNADFAVASTADNDQFIFQVEANTEYSFRIYLWIEGYDAECVNGIFAQKFRANIDFAWAETEAELQ